MINSLTINGILGKPAEYKQLASTSALTFSMAYNQSEKDKNGQYTNKAIWYKVVLFGKQADYFSNQNLDKGSQVLVLGKLSVEEYTDKNGKKQTQLKIIATNLVVLAKKDAEKVHQQQPSQQNNGFNSDYDDVPF
jgi:single-strand DNA-binding protein